MCRHSVGCGKKIKFTICEMDDINVVLGLTFLEADKRMYKGKKRELVVQSDDKEFILPLTNSSKTFGGRLKFISAKGLLRPSP